MSRGLCLLFLALALNATARSGALRTLDGRSLEGEIQFTNGFIVVNATNTIAAANLQTLVFDADLSAATGPKGGGNGLVGFYFGNTNFAGSVFVRLDETIDFDWGGAEPAPAVPPDFFSVIWTGEVEAPTNGNYTFHIATDDGGWLFLDDRPAAASVTRREITETSSAPVALASGQRVKLKFMYFEIQGSARARLLWSGPGIAKSVIPKDRLHAKGFLPEHPAEPFSTQGLLATYYKNTDLSGETLTRVDAEVNFNWQDRDPAAGFPRTNFGVRWTGQLQADHSQDYTLHVLSDEPVRVWIDNRLVMIPSAQFYLTETKETVPLLAGERHDLRVESQSTSSSATFKLMWSSASTPKAVIPSTHLFPSRAAPARNRLADPSEKLPPGLLLRNGSFVASPVERATDSSIKAGGMLKNTPLSTVNVARILCQPLPPALAARIPAGRAGLLLTKGDFAEAEFRGMENNEIKVNSILFGIRTYDARKDVLAVVLRDVAPTRAVCEVRLRDQSLLRASQIDFKPNAVVVRDATLGQVSLAADDIVQINRLH